MSSRLPPIEDLTAAAKSKPMNTPGRYEYYMVQVPSNMLIDPRKMQGHELSTYVQDWATRLSEEGWEFYRIDNMTVVMNPGCLSMLLGGKSGSIPYSIMTFRRRRRSAEFT